MRTRALAGTAAAISAGAALLAGCSSDPVSGDAGAAAEATTAAQDPTATGEATGAPTATGSAAAPAPASPGPAAGGASAGDATAAVRAGGRCDLGQPHTEALVVGGAIDCGTLADVWGRAVADPAFAVHGNGNTITVDGWTCRAHQTRPVQTGYCENAAAQARFKVIHR